MLQIKISKQNMKIKLDFTVVKFNWTIRDVKRLKLTYV